MYFMTTTPLQSSTLLLLLLPFLLLIIIHVLSSHIIIILAPLSFSSAASSKPQQNLIKGLKTVKLMSTLSQLEGKCSVMFIYPHNLDYPDRPIQKLTCSTTTKHEREANSEWVCSGRLSKYPKLNFELHIVSSLCLLLVW